MIDFTTARTNMVESQIRPSAVTDRRVIDAFQAVPREAYVPKALQSIAYMDEDILFARNDRGEPRFLIEPMALARMIQLAEISPDDVVLNVGSCLGYSTAILARLADAVVSLECDEDLAARAVDILAEQGVDNAAVVTGALCDGYQSQGPYDAIIINGAVPAAPDRLLDQLNEGGRLVAAISEGALGRVHLFTRHGDILSERVVFDATIAPLPGCRANDSAFVF